MHTMTVVRTHNQSFGRRDGKPSRKEKLYGEFSDWSGSLFKLYIVCNEKRRISRPDEPSHVVVNEECN
jgi:hypothetical protein